MNEFILYLVVVHYLAHVMTKHIYYTVRWNSTGMNQPHFTTDIIIDSLVINKKKHAQTC